MDVTIPAISPYGCWRETEDMDSGVSLRGAESQSNAAFREALKKRKEKKRRRLQYL